MSLRIIVSGAQGKVGRCIVEGVKKASDMELVGEVDHQDDLRKAIQTNHPDAVIDFTTPEAAFKNAAIIVEENAHPVIGTTGFSHEQIEALIAQCEKKKLGGLIAPNFSIGAVLMMRYAKEAARYLPDVEIIEMHHNTKKDAPSGTAIKTAEMIASSRTETENIPDPANTSPARGIKKFGIPIHSVRLPGLIAHQTVIFGGTGETLTIREDTMSREAFVPGVLLACRKVQKLQRLVYGLELLL